MPSASVKPHPILALQQQAGNQAVQRLLHHASIYPKLAITQPDDPTEREADQVADRVMRMPDIARVAEGPVLERKRLCEENKLVQRSSGDSHASPAATVSPIVHEVLSAPGQPLDALTRAFFEPRFGRDFGGVTIHTGARASEAAQAVSAKAFTVGENMVFANDQYAPATKPGRQLLAHELSHIVQQSRGRSMLQRAETDTVPGCSKVTDSQTDVDAKVNVSLTASQAAAGSPPSGLAVAQGVANDLGKDDMTHPGRTNIEVWAGGLPSSKALQPVQSATKYAGVTYRLWNTPFEILNPTMKINGICVGSDKLGHFFQQGAQFQQIQSKYGTAAAEEHSEHSESGGYGLQTTGVFSNADREANRQGGRFYSDLIASPTMKFAIANYISSAWSEVDHPNFYVDDVGHQVWANVLGGDWAGFSLQGARRDPLTLKLAATVTGNISGTFTAGGLTGTLTGAISYNRTSVRASGGTAATPISGIHIDFDWTSGTDSGKGFLDSGGERHLGGAWGTGTSNSGRGSWLVDHT